MPAKKPTGKKESFNFEASMTELEDIVDQIESGELSLEEAMLQFEKGVVLTRQCQQALQAAEQKVKILLEKQGDLSLEDFADEDDE
jgi:exodeoxyribonuclease VII small subunit